jgi:hypothetical protein
VISPLRRLRLEDDEYEASLGYIVRPSLKKTINKLNQIEIFFFL